jgi:Tfp pilus assembly protein PilO
MKPTAISGVVIFLCAGLIGYHAVYRATRRELTGIEQELSEQRDVQALRVSLAASLDHLEQLRKRLPPQPDTEWLIGELTQVAKAAGVQLSSIVPQEPVPSQDATRLSVLLRFEVSYHELGKFVSAMENTPSFMWVSRLEIARSEEGRAEVQVAVSTWHVPALGPS